MATQYVLYYGQNPTDTQHPQTTVNPNLPFHFEISTTVTDGLTLTKEEKTSTNGLIFILKRLEINRTFTSAQICMQLPDDQGWMPDTTLRYGTSAYPQFNVVLQDAKDPLIAHSSERCYQALFGAGIADYQQAETIDLSVEDLWMDAATNPDDACLAAQVKLAEQNPGVEISCGISDHSIGAGGGGGGGGYAITTKPADMTDAKARQIVEEAFKKIVKGPWTVHPEKRTAVSN